MLAIRHKGVNICLIRYIEENVETTDSVSRAASTAYEAEEIALSYMFYPDGDLAVTPPPYIATVHVITGKLPQMEVSKCTWDEDHYYVSHRLFAYKEGPIDV